MADAVSVSSFTSALQAMADQIRGIQGAILDAFVVVDAGQRIAAYNLPFVKLFSGGVSTSLEGVRLDEVLSFRLNDVPIDPVRECLTGRAAVRFDKVAGQGPGEMSFRFIVSAAPLRTGNSIEGVLLLLRNLSSEIAAERDFQRRLSEEVAERKALEESVRGELLVSRQALNDAEAELMSHIKGLKVPRRFQKPSK